MHCTKIPLALVIAAAGILNLARAAADEPAESRLSRVWIDSGEDKTTRSAMRPHRPAAVNPVWNGQRVSLDAARNETVAFNVVLATADAGARDVSVRVEGLSGCHVELFYVRYLQIRGLSKLAYHHYDERHVPERFRRPHDSATGKATGRWEDRPDHDQEYPDIAVPLELHPTFDVEPQTNQSVWCDVYVPLGTPAGILHGRVVVTERGVETHSYPIELQVRSFELPAEPTARPFMYVSASDINFRYLGERWPHDAPGDIELNAASRAIMDRHFQLAKQHGVALITEHIPVERLESSGWLDHLTGATFTPARGYQGRGAGLGNGVFSIGTYGEWQAYWPGSSTDRDKLRAECQAFEQWLASRNLLDSTDVFLYVADESNDLPAIEQWASWASLPTFATLGAPEALQDVPSLKIVCSTATVNETEPWAQAVRKLQQQRRFWMYNGFRPASGTFLTEDDGIALRQLAWGQFKMRVDRWFFWEGTYYRNQQGGTGETNVFRSAHTFGGKGTRDASLGETGYNYQNGDGVLFYPGTDTLFPEDSYGVDYPLASLRLKHWRRGIQDHDYLSLARAKNPEAVDALVAQMCPRIMWENGVANRNDPTYGHCDISWSTDPAQWDAARKKLAEIIEDSATPSDSTTK